MYIMPNHLKHRVWATLPLLLLVSTLCASS